MMFKTARERHIFLPENAKNRLEHLIDAHIRYVFDFENQVILLKILRYGT